MLHRLGLAALAIVSVLVAVPGPAAAQMQAPPPAAAVAAPAVSDDPYTVGGVEVDVTAASAAEARDKAIQEAQRKAFTTLFKRLAADGATRVPPSVGDSDLQRMIQGFEIEKERGSAVRYVGSLSFKFRRKAVRTYLSNLGVSVVEPAPHAASAPGAVPGAVPAGSSPPNGPPVGVKPTLVLPVAQSKGRPLLWEERTPWRSAWEDFAATAGAAKVVIPPGELTDIADIGATEAMAGDAGSLAKIAAHYDAGDVVVAVLPATDRLDPAAGLQVTLTRYGADGRPEGAADAVSVPVGAGEAPAAVLGRAVSAVVERLASLPQSPAPVMAPPPPANAEAQLQVAVPISGMQDWLEIRRRLTSNPMVLAVDTVSLTRSRVDVTIRYRGEQDGLRAMLDRDSLTLAPAPGGWSLYLKSSAQAAPGGTPPAPVPPSGPRPLGPGPAAAPPPGAYYAPAPAPSYPAYPARPGYSGAPAPSEYDAEPAAPAAEEEPPPAYEPGRGAYPGGSRF